MGFVLSYHTLYIIVANLTLLLYLLDVYLENVSMRYI